MSKGFFQYEQIPLMIIPCFSRAETIKQIRPFSPSRAINPSDEIVLFKNLIVTPLKFIIRVPAPLLRHIRLFLQPAMADSKLEYKIV